MAFGHHPFVYPAFAPHAHAKGRHTTSPHPFRAYARHNTGKTLLLLHMASEAIEKGVLAAEDFIFINADDSSSGIAGKLAILDELGAHTLVPGQNGFKPESFEPLLLKAVETNTARGTLVAIDTLKKFVDLMHKKQSSQFGNTVRQYVTAGGTLLGLAHVNKRRGEDGRAVHAGTSDILDDFDAGYIIDELNLPGHPGQKFVEFQRLKARGGGVQSVAYTYAGEDHLSYAERLASVRLVDQDDLDGIKRQEAQRSDAELIAKVVESLCPTIHPIPAFKSHRRVRRSPQSRVTKQLPLFRGKAAERARGDDDIR